MVKEESYFKDMRDFILSNAEGETEEDVDFDSIDFSDASGGFKRSLKKGTKKSLKKKSAIHKKNGIKQKVFIPSGRTVIVEGMDKLLLGSDDDAESIRNIGYYQGKRLNAIVLTINNTGLVDFDVELFNPSMPLDYLYSTSLNLNDKVKIAGSGADVSYTDILNSLSTNMVLIPNMRIVVAGAQEAEQRTQALQILNKGVDGSSFLKPLNISLYVDNMQVNPNIIQFDLMRGLGRGFVPDGMDIMKYKVLAGNVVTFCFFMKQKQLKRLLFPEMRTRKVIGQ